MNSLGLTRSVIAGSPRVSRLKRVPYQQRPARYEYRTTAKGRDLWPVVLHLLRWGDAHYPEPGGVPRVIEHTGCGGHPDDHLLCDRCGEPLSPYNVSTLDGPGLVAAGHTAA
jgi:hypothetical protein